MPRKILFRTLSAIATPARLLAREKGVKRARMARENYVIDAEINPHTQALSANVKVRFLPLDNDISSASFELNNAFNLTRVVDESGQQIPASRSGQDLSVRLNFPAPLLRGKPTTLTFTYDGHLTGAEESPVYGIKFAAIQNDFAYLMYPARWFPINDYTIDRYTADQHITVPEAVKVLASGLEKSEHVGTDKMLYSFQFTKPSFPGSIALVQGEPQRVSSQGVTTSVYFRQKQSMANAYGEEIGKVMTFLTSVYGLAPQANLALVETEDGTPNGYAAPGVVFLSPHGIGNTVGTRLLANQLSRQWWSTLVSPINRDHMWLENGNARYAELLWEEHTHRPAAFEEAVHDHC